MSGRLSGIDAISPAFERTKKQLFAPFRFGHWVRLAVVCILTGEVTGGGGGFGGGSNLNLPTPPRRPETGLLSQLGLPSNLSLDFLAWALVGVIALVLLVLVMIYISSVFRFILFDAVLKNRCHLGEGWRRWQRQGSSYFLWQIGFGLASLAAFGIVIGVPIFAAWRTGLFSNPDKHFVLLILGGVVVFALFVLVILLSALGSLFAKDFVVPVMALEGRGVVEGWRRVFPMLGQEKGAYAVYVLMKILLAVGSALVFGIIDFMVVLMLLIPVGLAGIAIFVFAKTQGITWNALTIGAVAAAGAIVIFLLLSVVAFVSTPVMVFFQAYSMHFFASRYFPLESALASSEPPPPAPPSALAPVPIT
jgi:MFS family permease